MGKYTEDQLFAKLEKADAAGDSEAAKAIADEIRSMRSQPASPSMPPTGQPAYGGEAYDPTEGMSGYEKFMAGAGKAVSDTGFGAKQLGAMAGNTLGMVDDSTVDRLFAEAKERNKLDAPLMDTGAGMSGNIAGNIATMLAPGGIVRSVGAIPAIAAKAPMAAKIGSAMMLPKTWQQAAGIGAISGAIQPGESGSDKAITAATGAGLGILPMGVSSIWNAAAKKAAALTESGQVRNISEGIRVVLGDSYEDVIRAMERAPAGATAGEVKGAPFISALQRTAAQTYAPVMQKLGGVMDDASRAAQNRLNNALPGTSADLISARDAATKGLYSAVEGQDVPIDDFLINLLKADPAQSGMKKAAQVARTRAAAQGIDPTGITSIIPENAIAIKGEPLMNLKKEMAGLRSDDISQTAVKEWNKSYGQWLRDVFPDYKAADDVFADMSKGVNQSQILEEVIRRSTNLGDGGFRPNAFLKAIESKALPKTATGWDRASWADLTKDQKKALLDVAKFSKGRYTLETAGKMGGGSDTVQKATIAKMLDDNTLPPILSNILGAKTMGVSKAAEAAYTGRAAAKAGDALANLLADPKLLAASLKKAKMPNNERAKLTRLLSAGGAFSPALYSSE